MSPDMSSVGSDGLDGQAGVTSLVKRLRAHAQSRLAAPWDPSRFVRRIECILSPPKMTPRSDDGNSSAPIVQLTRSLCVWVKSGLVQCPAGLSTPNAHCLRSA